jgi:hypothetical protein
MSTFRIWKNGEVVSAEGPSSDMFHAEKPWDPIDPKRVFSVDTESLTVNGQLRTVINTAQFHDSGVIFEATEDGHEQCFVRLLEEICKRFSSPSKREWFTLKNGAKRNREVIPEPCLSVWFNLPYDIGRLLAEHRIVLRSIASGSSEYRTKVNERFEIEVLRFHLGNAANFDWIVRDRKLKRIVRVLGLDLTGYWKRSLGSSAKAMKITEKVDIVNKLGNDVYSRPFERFTHDDWKAFCDYAMGDVQTTLDLFHATTKVISSFYPGVLKNTGVIPNSAPGAAAKIVFNHAFEDGLESWRRPPEWADQMGCDAYFGGRVFCIKPGRHRNMAIVDLKAAYAFQQCLLPDPVQAKYHAVRSAKGFDVDEWAGRYGVLYVSGRCTDDLYPAFRTHDASQHGRLRYVFGRFCNIAVTIPELVIGVLRGALSISNIHKGYWIQGSNKTSFLRKGIQRFFKVKEDKSLDDALRELAKLLGNSNYGKLIEVQDTDYLIAEKIPVPPFEGKERVADTIARIYAWNGPNADSEGLYWGSGERAEDAKRVYQQTVNTKYSADRAIHAVISYIEALVITQSVRTSREGETISLAEFLRTTKRYSCGHFFMPSYASQITGATSAMVGLMAHTCGALQGDTDSVHVQLPDSCDDVRKTDGFQQYFEIMKLAKYPSPIFRDGKYEGGLRDTPQLGAWECETEGGSVESLLLRPKVYSHKLEEKTGGISYKQAHHGFARFWTGALDKVAASRVTGLSDEEARKEEKRISKEMKRVKGEELHRAMGELLDSGTFDYISRKAPVKIKEAIRRGVEPGEFLSREMKVVLTSDPNTWTDREGIIRWKPFQ